MNYREIYNLVFNKPMIFYQFQNNIKPNNNNIPQNVSLHSVKFQAMLDHLDQFYSK